MQKLAYIRLATALIICLSVMLYQVKNIFVPIEKPAQTAEIGVLADKEDKITSSQEKTDTAQNREQTEKEENSVSEAKKAQSQEQKNN